MSQCRQNIEELELHIKNTSRHELGPTGILLFSPVIQEVLRNQHFSFLAISSKVAATHDQIEKCQKIFEDFEAKNGIKPARDTMDLEKSSFSQMASLLVPSTSLPSTNTLNPTNPIGTTFGATTNTGIFGQGQANTTNTTSLFGKSTGMATSGQNPAPGGLFTSNLGTGAFGQSQLPTLNTNISTQNPTPSAFGASSIQAPSTAGTTSNVLGNKNPGTDLVAPSAKRSSSFG
jgi:hypothetical protein